MMRRDRRGEMGVAVWAGLGPTVGRGPASGLGGATARLGSSAGFQARPAGFRLPDGRPLSCLFFNCDTAEARKASLEDEFEQATRTVNDPFASPQEVAEAIQTMNDSRTELLKIVDKQQRCCPG